MPDRAPLKGVRVLDLSRIIAGPNATLQLADLGAEVIKVEAPGDGDDSRRMKPPEQGGEGHFYMAFNRNKESMVVDLKQAAGQALVREMATKCHVMVENFRPGVADRLGVGYDAIRPVNESIIYCSVSAYGQTGMMVDRPGLDPIFQAEMGMMSITGEIDGQPMRSPLSIIDTITSLYAATAISAALVDQQATGTGRHIDVSLMGGAVSALGNAAQYYFATGETPPRMANAFPTVAPVGAFEGSDGGMFYIACGTQRLYENLVVKALGRPDLRDDPRFQAMPDRVRHRDAIMGELADIFSKEPRDHWVKVMREASVPCGPIRSIGEALESPEVREAGLVQTVAHPTAGDIEILRSPIGVTGAERTADRPPPLHGEHTDTVLKRLLNLPGEEIARLRAEGVVA